jgi:hypothetical protein
VGNFTFVSAMVWREIFCFFLNFPHVQLAGERGTLAVVRGSKLFGALEIKEKFKMILHFSSVGL